MQKVYTGQKTDRGWQFILPIGHEKLAGMSVFLLKIRKPSGTIVTKSLDINNLIPENKHFQFILATTDVDELGIYDYQVINTTNSYQQIGKVLQFHIDNNVF